MPVYKCPGCDEQVSNRPPYWVAQHGRTGWARKVDPMRLAWSHGDWTPLCGVETRRGYQPALPRFVSV